MLIKTYTLEIKKSKFIGYLYEIKDETEAKEIIEKLKKEHPKARHIPYSYIINNTARKTDDKEPHNTAGIQLYNLLMYNNKANHLIAIVRYFGGTKLGASNLLRAYAECGKNLLQ